MGVLGGLLKAKSGAASFGRTRDLSRGGGDAPTPSNSELHCTLLNAHCTLHTAHCMLNTASCSMHSAHCSLYSLHCTLLTARPIPSSF